MVGSRQDRSRFKGAPTEPARREERLATAIRLREVCDAGLRLEASAFSIEARHAVSELRRSGLPLVPLYSTSGFCREAHNAFRFRRIYVEPEHGVPFLSSSDIISLRPECDRYLSKKLTKRLDELIVRKWDVLISCSGTIGNVALANESLAGNALSQDAIRVRAQDAEAAGFVAAFLRSYHGRVQVTQATYGSVVQHIEPEHLSRVLIPDLHPLHRISIGRKFVEACELRDQANDLLDHADVLLHRYLGLPPLPQATNPSALVSVANASQLRGRLEASFHAPQARAAEERVQSLPTAITTAGDPRITREIRAITRFRKRVYVPHGGIPLLSSKQLFQVDPVDVKGLARGAHTKDLAEIVLEENMVIATCSGTIGRVQIIPRYMAGWTANQHATRFLAADGMHPGYLYAWLASDYGRCLMYRHAYGSVILEVDREMFASMPVPLPDKASQDAIGEPVIEANELRDRAWHLEQKAIAEIERRIRYGSPAEDEISHG